MIGQIEKRIIEMLQNSEIFDGMDIQSFPANFEDYNFTSSLGCILVKYNGEDLTEPETLGATVQTDTYSYSVFVGLRSLTVLSEGYPILNEVKDLLTGFRVNGKKLYPTSVKYSGKINYNDNFWNLTFKIKLTNATRYDHKVIPGLWENRQTVSAKPTQ